MSEEMSLEKIPPLKGEVPATTTVAAYTISQQKRKRVEQSFGRMKMIGLLRKVKLRGREKVGWLFTFVGAAYDLVRLRRLRAEAVA